MKAKKFLRIAHRGALHERTENTLKSLQQSLEDGFDAVEIDVRLCATGEPVVFHDKTLMRLANDPRLLHSVSLKDLRAISLKGGGHISTLKEVLEGLETTRIFIDIKEKRATEPVIKILRASKKQHDFTVMSKKIRVFKMLCKLDPNKSFKRGLVSSRLLFFPTEKCSNYDIDTYVTHKWLVSWWLMYAAKKNNVRVIAYPVHRRTIELILKAHGVQGIEYNKNLLR